MEASPMCSTWSAETNSTCFVMDAEEDLILSYSVGCAFQMPSFRSRRLETRVFGYY